MALANLFAFTKEQPVFLALYTFTSALVFVLQGVLLPRLVAHPPSGRMLVAIALTLLAVAATETLASHAYATLAPALEYHLSQCVLDSELKYCCNTATRINENGTLVARISVAVETLSTIGNFCARFALRGTLAILILLVSTLYYSRPVALLLFGCLLIVALTVFYLARRVASATQYECGTRSHALQTLNNVFDNWEHVRATRTENVYCAHYAAECKPRTLAYTSTCSRMRDFVAATLFGCALSFSAAGALALYQLKQRTLTLVQFQTLLYSFLVYFGVFALLAQQLAALAYNVGQLVACSPPYPTELTYLQTSPPLDLHTSPADHSPCARTSEREAVLVFQNARAPFGRLAPLTLSLAQCDHLLFVAPSGAGKSSLLRAAALQLPLAQGSIQSVLGTEYIPQECTVFEGTLMDNLRVGNGELTLERIRRSVAPVLLDRFQNELETRTSDTWSLGQRKLAVVLRTVLRSETTSTLLADEPFASLDAEAACVVARLIEEVTKHRAAIVISHEAHTYLLPSFRVVSLCTL